MKDGENILGEFLFGAVACVVENHDPTAVLLGKPLNEYEPESGQPVSVDNHNAVLIAAVLIAAVKSLQ